MSIKSVEIFHFSDTSIIEKGTVCFSLKGFTCHWKESIQIKNCGKFFVYQLPPPSKCDLRYCSDRYGE